MDYAALINYHRARGADVTVATTPADEDHALHLGILKARPPGGGGFRGGGDDLVWCAEPGFPTRCPMGGDLIQ